MILAARKYREQSFGRARTMCLAARAELRQATRAQASLQPVPGQLR